MSDIVKRFFLRMILGGLKAVEDIPVEYRDEIQAILDEQEEE